MKKWLIICFTICLVFLFASCSNSTGSSQKYNRSDYGQADYIADQFGTNSDEVNNIANALGRAMR